MSYRCAVVVFVDVPFGVDQADADAGAELAIRRNLRRAAGASDNRLAVRTDRGEEHVQVIAVRDLGTAMSSGYVRTTPTTLAWQRAGIAPEQEDQ